MHGGDDGGDSPARPAKRQRPSAPVLDVPAKLKSPLAKSVNCGVRAMFPVPDNPPSTME